MRTISTYLMPDGSIVEADHDELMSVRNYYEHSPEVVKKEHTEALQQKQADELFERHLAGETITDEQLAFVKSQFPEAFKKRRKAKPKATKPEPKISAARAADLAKRGITNHAPSD